MLNENKTNSLSIKDSENLTQKGTAASTHSRDKLDDGQTSTESESGHILVSLATVTDFCSAYKRCTLPICSEDDTTFQNSSNKELSETSLDVQIPSYPGSPRSIISMCGLRSSSTQSYIENNEQTEEKSNEPSDINLSQAINYLNETNDFLEAAALGDHAALEVFLSKSDLNIQQMDYLGRNALHFAVRSENERSLILLLKAGVSVNVKDNVGMTPLSLCLMRCPSVRVANLLFDHGAVVLPRSSPLDTGLFIQFAMMCKPTVEEKRILRLLVAKGCVVNDPEAPGGRQALHFAAMSNNCELIEVLLELGANIYATNARNETPKRVALIFKCREAYSLLCKLEESYATSSTESNSDDAYEVR